MFLHSLISEGCELITFSHYNDALELDIACKWNIKHKLFICITFNKLGAVSQLLPWPKDTAATALTALLEVRDCSRSKSRYSQVQAEGQAALLGRLLLPLGAAAAAPLWPCDRAPPTARRGPLSLRRRRSPPPPSMILLMHW